MKDEVFSIDFDGWETSRDIELDMVKKKDGTTTGKMKSFEGRIIPKKLMIDCYFPTEQKDITCLENDRDETTRMMDEIKEEHGGEEGLLCNVINDKGNIPKNELQKRIKEIKSVKEYADELNILKQYEKLIEKEAVLNMEINNLVF